MYIKNAYISLAYKAVLILTCLFGLYLNSGLPGGTFRLGFLNYYTILSNLLCLFFFIAALAAGFSHLKYGHKTFTYAPRFKGAVVFAITVTMLIYHFVLAPAQFSMGGSSLVYSLENLLVHYIVPLMVILDWLLFDNKGNWKWKDPLLWLLVPYIYFIFVIIRGSVGSTIPGTVTTYPYDFVNIAKYGFQRVLLNVLFMTIVFIPIGYLYVFFDRALFRKSCRPARKMK